MTRRLEEAVDIYRDIWVDLTKGSRAVDSDDRAVLANLLVALRVLCRFHEAIELVKRERAHVDQDQGVLLRAAIAAHEGGETSLVSELLPRLEPSSDQAMLTIQVHLRTGDWKGLAEQDCDILDRVNEAELPVCRTALTFAQKWMESNGTPTADDLNAIVQDAADDIRASILAADLSWNFGIKLLADKAWDNARRLVTPASHRTSKISVARHAFTRGRWRDTADLLLTSVDLKSDSDELRQLTIALAHENPQLGRVILPVLTGFSGRIHASIFSF